MSTLRARGIIAAAKGKCAMYYLETNAIRILSKELGSMQAEFPGQIFTSALAIMELLNGMSTKDYEFRRKAVYYSFESKIGIDWRLPSECFANAFGIRNVSTEKSKLLKRTAEIVIEEPNMNAAVVRSKTKEAWSIEELVALDGKINEPTIEQMKENVNAYRNLRTNNDKELDLAKEWRSKGRMISGKIQAIIEEAIKVHIQLMATDMCKLCDAKINSSNIEMVMKHYDNSLNVYFTGIALYQIDKLYGLNEMGRNDFYDISHLAYLNKSDNILVSNDGLFDRIFDKYVKYPVIKVEAFKKKLT